MFNFNRSTSTESTESVAKDKKVYDNTNRGGLWPNRFKFSANAPDLTGKININGEDYMIAAWQKTDKDGNTYLSLSHDTGRKSK
tara:strand:+ start:777 stop:1028 length:252 start_codon:yes stop_codon:yes gene_type:complete